MTITDKIRSSLETVKHTVDSERIQIVKLSTLKFDKEFKELFSQEPEKVERIYTDMISHGFDKSQPIIVTKDNRIIDGNSRYLAATKAGIKYVPIVVKEFKDKDEALKYELHLQLDRRNLSDSEILKMFQKLEAMKTEAKAKGKSTAEYSDVEIGKILKKSPRQVQKLREISKKVDTETLNKVASGELSINQAHSTLKKGNHLSQNGTSKITKKGINTVDFCKGVHFALNKIANGMTPEEILAQL